MLLQFGLAKVSADAGKACESFDYLLRANRIARTLTKYDEAATLRHLAQVEKIFTPEMLNQRAGSGSESNLPVFIVGMPRSGTTLVEQILASHPGIHGAGELYEIGRIAGGIADVTGKPYPEGVLDLTGDGLGKPKR